LAEKDLYSSLLLHMSDEKTSISEVFFYRIKHAFGQCPFWLTKFVNELKGLDDFSLFFEKVFMNLVYMMEIYWKKYVCCSSLD
jgi:hypothetical protein